MWLMFGVRPVKNKVRRLLGLSGGVNQKLTIIAKLLQPAGNNRRLDSLGQRLIFRLRRKGKFFDKHLGY